MDAIFEDSVPDAIAKQNDASASGAAGVTEDALPEDREVNKEELKQMLESKPNDVYGTASEHITWKFEEGATSGSNTSASAVLSLSDTRVDSNDSSATSIFEHIVALDQQADTINKVNPPLNRVRRDSARGRAGVVPEKEDTRRTWYLRASRLLLGAAVAAFTSIALRAFALCMKDGLAPGHHQGNIGEKTLPYISPVVFHFGENPGFRSRKLPLLPTIGKPGIRQEYGKDLLHAQPALDPSQNDIESLRRSCSEFAAAEFSRGGHDADKQPKRIVGNEPRSSSPKAGTLIPVTTWMPVPDTGVLSALILGILHLTPSPPAARRPGNASLQPVLTSGATTPSISGSVATNQPADRRGR
ncbi:UNVERIFIED_CONTAM: transmembrane protein, putative [Hammondia hammondi]|eukprot:XP_008882008.1 transmembrane protein, putative [Hammondia hammondi]